VKIKKRYIVDENQRPVDVVLDLATFERIEAALECRLFGRLLRKAAAKKQLPIERAKALYARIRKRA
jgi:hypothetical protein